MHSAFGDDGLDSRGRNHRRYGLRPERYTGGAIAPQLWLLCGDQAASIHMLVQLNLKFAANKVKIGLVSVDGSEQMNQTLITLEGHAASRKVEHLHRRLRSTVGRIRSMQCQLDGTEKLDFALLRFIPETHSSSFTLRKPKACRAIRRRQTRLMIKRYVASCDLYQSRAISLLGSSGRDLLVRGSVQIDLYIPGAANVFRRVQIVASTRVQIVKALTRTAVRGDPYVLQQAAAAFHELGRARGPHCEFRTVTHHLREGKARRTLLHARWHSRWHVFPRLP